MIPEIFLLFGVVWVIGSLMGTLTRYLKITGVVGYVFVGILLGPYGADFVNLLGLGEAAFSELWDLIVSFVLGFVALHVGLELSKDFLKKLGRKVTVITLSAALLTLFLVFLGVYLYTGNFVLALLLGSVATATAPASKVAVIQELRAKGSLTSALKAIAGLDDAIAIIIFTIVLVGSKVSLGASASPLDLAMKPLWEILGSLVLGGSIGSVFSLFGRIMTERRLKEKQLVYLLTLISIVLAVGIAEMVGMSPLLTCMAIGACIVNLAPLEGKYLSENLRMLMLPLYIVFFTFAGMKLDIGILSTVGLISVIYVICRSGGKIIGAYLPLKVMEAPSVFRYAGIGLLSQAGVALGLAALAQSELVGLSGSGPHIAVALFTVVLSTDIIFEIVGPIGARTALAMADEMGKD